MFICVEWIFIRVARIFIYVARIFIYVFGLKKKRNGGFTGVIVQGGVKTQLSIQDIEVANLCLF